MLTYRLPIQTVLVRHLDRPLNQSSGFLEYLVVADHKIQDRCVFPMIHDPLRMVGSIFKGRITKVDPMLGVAFVAIGHQQFGILPIKSDSTMSADQYSVGQYHIVQIRSIKSSEKWPILSRNIELHDRYVIHKPFSKGIGVPVSIKNTLEKTLFASLQNQEGLIIRSAASECTTAMFTQHLQNLYDLWDCIREVYQTTKKPGLLHPGPPPLRRLAMDWVASEQIKIVTAGSALAQFVQSEIPCDKGRVLIEPWVQKQNLLDFFGVQDDWDTMQQPHVHLSNGVGLVIENTHALTAIDVNSHQYQNSNIHALDKANQSILAECVRQIRIRRIFGTIVVDWAGFPKKNKDGGKDLVLECRELFRVQDRSKVWVSDISPLGLMQVSRSYASL